MTAATTEDTTERTAWARNLGSPVRHFLGTETGSAVVLAGAVLAALVWAGGAPGSYHDLWATELAIDVGGHGIAADLHTWVNEGLMALFFLVVGLEAKRELDLGELRERTRVWIPIAAALGGMVVPIGIYLLATSGGDGASGWGVAMSSDTALALGALALAAPSGSTRLRVFLLTLAVVDDLGALLVIVVAYTDAIDATALGIAAGLFAILALLRFAPGSSRGPLALVVGVAIWVAMFESGVDPVIAGLAIGLVTAAYPPRRRQLERATDLTREFREQPTPGLASSARRSLAEAISPNERLQYALHPWTSYVIVPLFALANAGVHLTGSLLSNAATSPITIGIVLAFVVGKPLGITAASWLATRRMLGGVRLSVTWPGLIVTGCAAGVGFTVSFLIASLALTGTELDEAKIGVLVAAVTSPLLALAVFRGAALIPDTRRLEQLRRTADAIIDLSDDVDPLRDHVRGDPDGSVTLLEYADFECPYCGRAEPTIRRLLAEHGRDPKGQGVRYVFRHLPLADVHPHAQLAAEASEAAHAQGAFWPMHDLLMANQAGLTLGDVGRYAGDLGLDVDRLVDDVSRRRYRDRIDEDVASADASGVSGTPTFFVNGRRHHGVYDIDTLAAAIRQAKTLAAAELAATRRTEGAG